MKVIKTFSEFSDLSYEEFKQFCESILNSNIEDFSRIDEGFFDFLKSIPGKLKAAWDFIKTIGSTLGSYAKDLVKALMNTKVFSLLKGVGFSLKGLFEWLKKGYDKVIEFRDKFFKFVSNKLPAKPQEWIKKIDEFLKAYPVFKAISGPLLAYMLYYIWNNAVSFTGDPEYDFNVTDIYNAFVGKLGFADVFAEENGAKLLTFVMTNSIFGLTFPWANFFDPSFYFAVGYTLMKMIGSKIPWKKPAEVKIETE